MLCFINSFTSYVKVRHWSFFFTDSKPVSGLNAGVLSMASSFFKVRLWGFIHLLINNWFKVEIWVLSKHSKAVLRLESGVLSADSKGTGSMIDSWILSTDLKLFRG